MALKVKEETTIEARSHLDENETDFKIVFVRSQQVVTPLDRKNIDGEDYILIAPNIEICNENPNELHMSETQEVTSEHEQEEEGEGESNISPEPEEFIHTSPEDVETVHNPMVEQVESTESSNGVLNPMMSGIVLGPTYHLSTIPLWINIKNLELDAQLVEFQRVITHPIQTQNGISLAFHPDTQLIGDDIIEIYNSVDHLPTSLFRTIRASQLDSLPSPNNPLYIKGDGQIGIKFVKTSPLSWGYKAVGFPCVVPKGPFDAIINHSRAIGRYEIFESKHPYDDSADYSFSTTIAGAAQLAIYIDPLTSTEKNYDYLTILGKQYSGGRGGSEKEFPWMIDPLMIDGNNFEATFHSDGSNNDWGYRMIVFDASLLIPDAVASEGKGLENYRKQPSDIFCYFENRSLLPQSVFIDMPIRDTTAYFEVLISTTSTKDSYIQVGAVVGNSSIRIQHPSISTITTSGTWTVSHVTNFTITDAANFVYNGNNGSVQTETMGANRTFTITNLLQGEFTKSA